MAINKRHMSKYLFLQKPLFFSGCSSARKGRQYVQRGSFLATADALEGEERSPWAGDQQEHVRGFCSQHCGVAVTAASSKGKQKCDF